MTRDTFDHFQPHERGLFGDNELARDGVVKVNLCDLNLFLHNDNPAKLAIAVSADRQTPFAQWIWLPRSLIEYERTGSFRNTVTVKVTLPERLAKEKGLV